MRKYGSNLPKDPAILSDQDCPTEDGDENPERGNWTNKTEYMLSMIGFAIGLGNIWRFPYVAFKNGGGAFLIPYFIMMVLCGIPLFFLESAIGQFCSQSPINVWRAVPILQGVGFSMVIVNALIAIYYNVIVAYSMYYLFASFQFPLPWSKCYSWSDRNCSTTPLVYCNESGVLVANWTQENSTCPVSGVIKVPVQSPSEQYWDRVALQRSSGLDETGPIVWHLALCLLLSSCILAASLIKGIKSSGKVVYFTATFPYVLILILLIRGVTLEGAREGLEFFIGSRSDLTKLTEGQTGLPVFLQPASSGHLRYSNFLHFLMGFIFCTGGCHLVWKDAATQTFFSLAIATSGVLTLASYSNFHNNMFLDSVIVTFTNHVTSVFAGFAIFSILGHMAHVYGKPIEEVVKEGFGLAFIVYPDALAKLPISTLWSILFFFMLFIIGLDSQFAQLEVVTTCLCDAFPELFKSKRPLLTIVSVSILYLLGLPCVTRAGIYWVTLMDQFIASWVLLFLALFEIIAIIYIYGGKNFIEDIEMMIGKKGFCFWVWWRACWYFISPCIILVILLWSLTTFVPPSYGKIQYPAWGLALGWCMVSFVLMWVPLVAVYKLMRAEGTLWQRVKSLCVPSEDWGPYLEIHRGERYSDENCRRRRAVLTNKQM